jgi:hypothetical protein
MKHNKRIQKLVKRISTIKQELMELGEMRPGTISEQYNVCGNPQCRCKDPHHPKKHGPYYQLSYTRHGKSRSEHIKKEMITTVRNQVKNYKRFVKLTEEWIDLSIELAQLIKSETQN